MVHSKTLSALADEYLEQAQVQTRMIEKNRKKLHMLPNPETSREAYRLKTLLNVLYAQRRDLISTANYLKRTYPEDDAA